MTARRSPRSDQSRVSPRMHELGQAGGEVLALGFVLLVGMTMLAVNAWAVIDAKIRVTGAARYAVRTLVEGQPNDISTAEGEFALNVDPLNADPSHGDPSGIVVGAVRASLLDKPKRITDLVVRVEIPDGPARCSRVLVEVSVRVPSFGFPRLGPWRDGFTVSGRQSEIIDPFRSGLPGEGDCRG